MAEILRRYGHQREAQPTASDPTASDPSALKSIPPSLGRPPVKRPSKLDAFESQIRHLLERYHKITNVRLFEELQASGYSGR